MQSAVPAFSMAGVYEGVLISSVYDGDTVTVEMMCPIPPSWTTRALRGFRVRLVGINAEEIKLKGLSKKNEHLPEMSDLVAKRSRGIAARDYLRALLEGKHCRMDCKGPEKYGRLLADLYMPGMNESVSEHVVRTGHAVRYMNDS